MNLSNYKDYAIFDYVNNISEDDDFQLGDVVIREVDDAGETNYDIGVIIQVHSKEEFRTDMFGNCDSSQIRLATQFDIDSYRPNLLNEGNFSQYKM